MTRDFSIDALKAFTISLVVLGHFLQFTISNYDDNYLFRLIYSFHMPLFIFLSGYLSYRKEDIYGNYIRRRFLSLIVPYFSWMIVSLIIKSFETDNLSYSLILRDFLYPDNGLWFLWVLFWMHFVLFCCGYLSKSKQFILLVSFASLMLFLVFVLNPDNIIGIKTFTLLFPYFILGYIVNKFKERTFVYLKNSYFLLPLFLFLAYYWQRNDSVNFNGYYLTSKGIIFIYKNIVASIGILVFMGLAKQIKNFSKILIYIGTNSMAIYAINIYCLFALLPFYRVLEINFFYYIYAIVFSVLIIFICLMFGIAVKKNKILSLFLLGKQ